MKAPEGGGPVGVRPEGYDCPQCGEATEVLDEGYCPPCSTENRDALALHEAQRRWWGGLTDRERDGQIRRAPDYIVRLRRERTRREVARAAWFQVALRAYRRGRAIRGLS